MKKFITVAVLLAVLTCVCCTFVACEEDETISYTIEEKTYAVGDTFAESDAVITVTLADETVRTLDKNLVFVGDDAETLHLDDDGNFTSESVGEYKIKVYMVENREDLEIGEWKVIVK